MFALITERIFGGMDIEYLTPAQLKERAKDMGKYRIQVETLLKTPGKVGSIERVGDYMFIIVTSPIL